MKRSKYCLVGIEDHLGVANVGGRLGASLGPSAFLKIFERLKGRGPASTGALRTENVTGLGSNIVENHRLAAELIRECQIAAGLTVVVGGGHDHGYSHLVGVQSALGSTTRLGCINIDAHLDVRKPTPEISSGSPFYLALEEKVLDPQNFIEFGIQRHCNSAPLWEYIEAKQVKVIGFEGLRNGKAISAFTQVLRKLEAQCDAIVISFDLDSVCAGDSPGVSAPQSEGFSASEAIEMMEIAGDSDKVASLGIFELNPVHDIDDRSARLAATSAWHFLDRALQPGH